MVGRHAVRNDDLLRIRRSESTLWIRDADGLLRWAFDDEEPADGEEYVELPPDDPAAVRDLAATARGLAQTWLANHAPDVSAFNLAFIWVSGEECGCCGVHHDALAVPTDCRWATDRYLTLADGEPVAYDQNGELYELA